MIDREATIRQLVLLIVGGLAPGHLAAAASLEIDPADVSGLVAEARARLTVAAGADRVEALGVAISRLNDCYARAIKDHDARTAVQAQRELNKLLDLYRPIPSSAAETSEAAGDARAELAAVRAHLEPFGQADDTTAELARRLVARLTRPELDTPDAADE